MSSSRSRRRKKRLDLDRAPEMEQEFRSNHKEEREPELEQSEGPQTPGTSRARSKYRWFLQHLKEAEKHAEDEDRWFAVRFHPEEADEEYLKRVRATGYNRYHKDSGLICYVAIEKFSAGEHPKFPRGGWVMHFQVQIRED